MDKKFVLEFLSYAFLGIWAGITYMLFLESFRVRRMDLSRPIVVKADKRLIRSLIFFIFLLTLHISIF